MCRDVTRDQSMRASSPRVRSICSWDGADAKITRALDCSSRVFASTSAAARPAAAPAAAAVSLTTTFTVDALPTTDISVLLLDIDRALRRVDRSEERRVGEERGSRWSVAG